MNDTEQNLMYIIYIPNIGIYVIFLFQDSYILGMMVTLYSPNIFSSFFGTYS